MRHHALNRLAAALRHLSALRTPVRGAALEALCDRLETLVFLKHLPGKAQHKARAHLPERRAEALAVLQQHGARPAPKTLLHMQRLHRLYLALGQTRSAARLLAQHGAALCETRQDETARAQIRVHLHLLEADGLHPVDRSAGLQALRAAAAEIRALPATLTPIPCLHPEQPSQQCHHLPCDVWRDWQHRAERLYHDWPLAQQGCDWQLEQTLALWPSWAWRDCLEFDAGVAHITRARHHAAWQRACASLDKAHIARRQHTWLHAHTPQDGAGLRAATEDCRLHLHAAIHHLEQMEYDPRSDHALTLWLRLFDDLRLDEPPFRPCLHAAHQAAGRNLARMEPHMLADLLPWAHEAPSLTRALHAARQVMQTFAQVRLAQEGFLASVRHDGDADPPGMVCTGWRAFGHAPGACYRENPGPFLNFVGEDALGLALLHALAPRPDAQVAACALARRLHPGQTAQGRLHSALILLHACCDPGLRQSLRRCRAPLPDQAAAETYLHAAREVDPDEPLIDLVLGLNAADKAEALEHLERAAQQISHIFSGCALKSLWQARFSILGQEAALARPWPVSGAACSNLACAEYLHRNLDSCGPGPVGHYLQAALDSAERFCADWKRGHGDGLPPTASTTPPAPMMHTGHPMWPGQYSQLCRQLAALRRRQKRWPEAQALYARGLASRESIYAHASGLLHCAQALGQAADAARWRRQIAALPTRDLEC